MVFSLLQIVGCHFDRIPEDSTSRYTEWHNNLTPGQLYTQVIMLRVKLTLCLRDVRDSLSPFFVSTRSFVACIIYSIFEIVVH